MKSTIFFVIVVLLPVHFYSHVNILIAIGAGFPEVEQLEIRDQVRQHLVGLASGVNPEKGLNPHGN